MGLSFYIINCYFMGTLFLFYHPRKTFQRYSKDIVYFFTVQFVFLCWLLFGSTPINLAIKTLYKNTDLLFKIISPTALAYFSWYLTMKRVIKKWWFYFFFIPLLSLLFTHFKFNVGIKDIFWLAIILLIPGSLYVTSQLKILYSL